MNNRNLIKVYVLLCYTQNDQIKEFLLNDFTQCYHKTRIASFKPKEIYVDCVIVVVSLVGGDCVVLHL